MVVVGDVLFLLRSVMRGFCVGAIAARLLLGALASAVYYPGRAR